MRFQRSFLLLFFFLVSMYIQAFDIKIRIFSDMTVDKVVVTPDTGIYYLMAYNSELQKVDTIADIFNTDPARTFHIQVSGKKVLVSRGGQKMGSYDALRFESSGEPREFRIDANGKKRIYQD